MAQEVSNRLTRAAAIGVGLVSVAAATIAALGAPAPAGAAVGDLTFAGCQSDDGTSGACTDVPEAPLQSTRGVAVSPDGDDVYAVGGEADSLVHFKAAPGGELTFAGCSTDSGANGCVNLPGGPLEHPFAVAVTPTGARCTSPRRGAAR